MVSVATWELSKAEWEIITRLRELDRTYDYFTLSVYGQGTVKRRVMDMAWTPRIRVHTQGLRPSLDE